MALASKSYEGMSITSLVSILRPAHERNPAIEKRHEDARLREREREEDERRLRAAVHEAAHATVALALDLPLVKVTLDPQPAALFDWFDYAASGRDYALSSLAGREAEMVLLGVDRWTADMGAQTDHLNVRRQLVKAFEPDGIEAELTALREAARELVLEHGDAILKVAEALYDEDGTLDANQVAELAWPQPVVKFLPAPLEPELDEDELGDMFAKREQAQPLESAGDIFTKARRECPRW